MHEYARAHTHNGSAPRRSIIVVGNGMNCFLLIARALRLRSNGTERNENVTVFLTPTVAEKNEHAH